MGPCTVLLPVQATQRPRDVICLMESVVVFLLHHGICFHLHQWRSHPSSLFSVFVLTLVLYNLGIRCFFVCVEYLEA